MTWLPRPYVADHCICEEDGEFEGREYGLRWRNFRAFVVVARRDRCVPRPDLPQSITLGKSS